MTTDDRAGRVMQPVIVVVSGLPRAGTSMLMQMLEAGGLPLLRDEIRVADPDNPRGFFEFEPVKRLQSDSAFLSQAVGRAVKVVAPLLTSLPRRYAYRIVFLERPLDEVLESQERMLARAGALPDTQAEGALRRAFEAALRASRDWIDREDCARACFVSHAETLDSPGSTAARIATFLASPASADRPLPPRLERWSERFSTDSEEIIRAMASVVDPTLYRARRRDAATARGR